MSESLKQSDKNGEDPVKSARDALKEFDDAVDMLDEASVSAWWKVWGAPALDALDKAPVCCRGLAPRCPIPECEGKPASTPSHALQNAAPQASSTQDSTRTGDDIGPSARHPTEKETGGTPAVAASPRELAGRLLIETSKWKYRSDEFADACALMEEAAEALASAPSTTPQSIHPSHRDWWNSICQEPWVTDHIELSSRAFAAGAALSAIACREPTEDDLGIIESDLGMAKGGWGDINGLEIIRACWRRYAAR